MPVASRHVATGATVVLDGKRLGKTPLVVTLPAMSKPAVLKVREADHISVRTRVSLDGDIRRHVQLKRAPNIYTSR